MTTIAMAMLQDNHILRRRRYQTVVVEVVVFRLRRDLPLREPDDSSGSTA